MPAVARVTDTGSYHGPYPDSDVIEGSPNMDVNSLPVHRVGDALESHPHERHLAKGSGSTDINSKDIGIVTSPVDCGGFIVTGSPNTTVD